MKQVKKTNITIDGIPHEITPLVGKGDALGQVFRVETPGEEIKLLKIFNPQAAELPEFLAEQTEKLGSNAKQVTAAMISSRGSQISASGILVTLEQEQDIEKTAESMTDKNLVIIDGNKLYKIESELGSGISSVVYLVRDPKGEEKALKIIIAPDRLHDKAAIEREVEMTRSTNNISRTELVLAPSLQSELKGVYLQGVLSQTGSQFEEKIKQIQSESKIHTGLLMTRLPGKDFLESHNEISQLDFAARAIIAQQVCRYVPVLHYNDTLHNDLKGENLLYDLESGKPTSPTTEANRVRVNLIDMGSATKLTTGLDEVQKMDKLAGTPGLIPQEARRGERGPKSDIYSTGFILRDLFFGNISDSIYKQLIKNEELGYPKQPSDILGLTTSELVGDIAEHKKVLPDLTNILRRFLISMVDNDYKKRPDSSAVENFFLSLGQMVSLSEEINRLQGLISTNDPEKKISDEQKAEYERQIANYQKQRDPHIARLRLLAIDPESKIPEAIEKQEYFQLLLRNTVPDMTKPTILSRIREAINPDELTKFRQSLPVRQEEMANQVRLEMTQTQTRLADSKKTLEELAKTAEPSAARTDKVVSDTKGALEQSAKDKERGSY